MDTSWEPATRESCPFALPVRCVAARRARPAPRRGVLRPLVSFANRLFQRGLDRLLRVDSKAALNLGRSAMTGGPGVAAELLAALQMMKADAFDGATGTVDYARLKESESYALYRACTGALVDFEPDQLNSREERLAFWINAYNALVIDAVIAFGLKGAVREDLGFFRRAAYVISGLRYSADDIEHGILRSNRRHFHPAILLPQFAPDDPRLRYTIRPLDPRIHCALVCASRSCPPIAAYDAGRIDEQLDIAARSFVNGGGVAVDADGAVVRLSPIFAWYRRDFGGKDGVREFLRRFLEEGPAGRALTERRCRLRYQQFDWSLNAPAKTIR